MRKASVEGREEGERGGGVCVTGKIDEKEVLVRNERKGGSDGRSLPSIWRATSRPISTRRKGLSFFSKSRTNLQYSRAFMSMYNLEGDQAERGVQVEHLNLEGTRLRQLDVTEKRDRQVVP